MSKLNQEALLFGLDSWHLAWTESYKERTGKEPSESTKQAYQQIKEMIQKPGVTEEWIDEKAKELLRKSFYLGIYKDINNAKDFIRSLIEEIAK